MYNLLCSLLLAIWLACVESTIPDGPCFDFPGNSFVHFTPNNFDNRDAIHYRLQFATRQPNAIIMYSLGPDGDEEALYIRNGFLIYHIFNVDPHGIGRQFGGHFMINQRVNTNNWITVHVYRSWPVTDVRRQRHFNQTGIVATINGDTYTDLDNENRNDINLSPTIFFGGYKERLSSTIGHLFGKISSISEEKNGAVFETPSLNYESKVMSPCQ